MLTFIELPVFTRVREVHLDDREFSRLQNVVESIPTAALQALKEAFDEETEG